MLTRRAGLIYIEASAKTGDNVEEAFLRTARSIYQNIQNGSLDLNAAGDVLLAVSCIVHIAAPLSHAFCACLPLLTAAPTRHRSRLPPVLGGRRQSPSCFEWPGDGLPPVLGGRATVSRLF